MVRPSTYAEKYVLSALGLVDRPLPYAFTREGYVDGYHCVVIAHCRGMVVMIANDGDVPDVWAISGLFQTYEMINYILRRMSRKMIDLVRQERLGFHQVIGVEDHSMLWSAI